MTDTPKQQEDSTAFQIISVLPTYHYDQTASAATGGVLDGVSNEWTDSYHSKAIAFNNLPPEQRQANTCGTPSLPTESQETSSTEDQQASLGK